MQRRMADNVADPVGQNGQIGRVSIEGHYGTATGENTLTL